MKTKAISFYEWQKQLSTPQECLKHIAEFRWPNGFQCSHCGHEYGYYINTRAHFECAQCHKNTSVTSGTLFHATKLPLTKWFLTINWVASDKGGISALRLS
jgi:transposase-like protein